MSNNTPIWRNGPPSKPVLCNACGSHWRTKGTLDSYAPRNKQNNVKNKETDNLASSYDGPHTKGLLDQAFKNIPKRKRSCLEKFVMTPMERFSKQLYDIAHTKPDIFFKEPMVGDILIGERDEVMFTPYETALGAVLLGSPSK
ncbi:hypothetical protein CTI12_AA580180 [Artemisia annua]|uniref:GATA-type domain-containing protein n=1 Tax=Artemisia annua TaxID=35608 RepID=A0A2U1KNT0_ARTAN|nr:hypothetical protein CTI12_AA580180 [Artemisia annua]